MNYVLGEALQEERVTVKRCSDSTVGVGVNKLNKSFYLRIERWVRKGPELWWPISYYLVLFVHPPIYSLSDDSKSFTSNLKGLSATGSSDGS